MEPVGGMVGLGMMMNPLKCLVPSELKCFRRPHGAWPRRDPRPWRMACWVR